MISSILLTAGQSKRMNGENKLTKEIQGIPLIKHSVKNILFSSIDELIVVLGYQKKLLKNSLISTRR
jgi:CTP:molybdopterin cytidylyltransferase MocA